MIPTHYRLLTLILAASLLRFAASAPLPGQLVFASPLDTSTGASRWTELESGVLKDGRTGLEWTRDDNGGDIDWNEAKAYCDGRGKGWRLPSLRELKTIFDPAEPGVRCAEMHCKVSSQFKLTGAWFWSTTQVGADSTDGDELAWGILMVNGAQTQAVRDASYGSRTLCVRQP
jgi:hypothetical protein